jgi:hypothetical protein
MNQIQLFHSTGQQKIDNIICGLIGLFETVFPGRIRSYYLVGSYADSSATPLSDIDIRVIFKDTFRAAEEEQMLHLRHYCRLISTTTSIDCPPLSEARLYHDEDWLHEPLGIKAAGILLYGQDIRASLPTPNLDAYMRNITFVPVNRMARIRGQTPPLIFPLTYPTPTGEFYGYDNLAGPLGAKVPSTHWLVHMIGFAATSLITLRAREIVTKKSDWLSMYQETINDQWTSLLEAIYLKGKQTWSYRLPNGEAERRELRELCRQTLAFENHYLTCYRDYLLAELHPVGHAWRRQTVEDTECGSEAEVPPSGGLGGPAYMAARDRQRFAIKRLKDIVYPDEQIVAALGAIDTDDVELRQILAETRQVYTAALG